MWMVKPANGQNRCEELVKQQEPDLKVLFGLYQS
jgi:hypothetical protein